LKRVILGEVGRRGFLRRMVRRMRRRRRRRRNRRMGRVVERVMMRIRFDLVQSVLVSLNPFSQVIQ